jgi:predicted lysophospholipase L1 biosynthesis ABC-type transport system permease subunit
LWLPGQEPADRRQAFEAPSNRVGRDYFRTLGLPMLEGRDFTDRDDQTAPRVVIVNRTLADRFWPRESAVGHTLVVGGAEARVIGVVADAEYRDVTEPPKPFLYLSYWQQDRTDTFNGDSRTHVRVTGDPAAMPPLLRRTIAGVDASVPIAEDQPLAERVDHHFRHVRAVGTVLTLLGSVAVFLSAIALYAVLASAVRRRTREVAIRMALGARQAQVSAIVVRQALALCGVGAAAGLVVTLPATHALRGLLFGVTAVDPVAFVSAAGVLVFVAGLASYLPVRRAVRIEPMQALRRE